MKTKINFYLIIVSFIISCQSESDKKLEYVLYQAGENRQELEAVLGYYKKDELKLKAARFLIENMLGHSGLDSGSVTTFQPTYDRYQALAEECAWIQSPKWEKAAIQFWKDEKEVFSRYRTIPDIRQVKADWLIREIDRSFKAWEENVYTWDASFDEFCQYILPYRFAEKVCVDNSRDIFYQRHAHFFSDVKKDFREVCDSLHYLYKDLVHTSLTLSSVPVYRSSSFEQIKKGTCDDKVWYNCLQMSALGMSVAADFVPAWGNRARGHSWNSVIIHGKTYPFEPFWDEDRWKYKQLYNNESCDFHWGRFRLPKVYRYTYQLHLMAPIQDETDPLKNVPSLFHDFFMKDVSEEYFKTTDVTLTLTEKIPENTRYCYLCVFGTNEWQPVQWGEIRKNGTVTFKGMGRDIIYLPMFYKNKELIPASTLFHLKQDGTQESITCSSEKETILVRNYTPYFHYPDMKKSRKMFGSFLIGYKDEDKMSGDTLCIVSDSIEVGNNIKILSRPSEYRYVQLIPSQDTTALCELSFFEVGVNTPVQDVKVSSQIVSCSKKEDLNMVCDDLSATGFRGNFKSGKAKENGIWLDLGKPRLLEKIRYIPYTPCYFEKDSIYELFYWDGRWIHAGEQHSDGGILRFENVPMGTIYRIVSKEKNGRIFTYKDGIVNWF